MGKNRMKQAGLVLALSLGLLICLTQVMPTSQAKTTSNLTGAPDKIVDPSKTISFYTNIDGISLTSTINASLSCPSSINAGSSGSGSLSVTAGTSTISVNYLIGTYTLPSFTTPLGSMDVPIAEIAGAGLKARFTAHISASVSSNPSGLVSPTSLTYMSSDSKSLSISTGALSSGSISVSSSYMYDGTIEIVLSVPLLGETTVLGPYNINSAVGSDTLSTTITVNPPPGPGTELLLITAVIVIVCVVAGVGIAWKKLSAPKPTKADYTS